MFGDELVALDEIVEREFFVDDFRERLVDVRQVGEVVEIIRVFAVVMGYLPAIGPDTDRSTGSITI